MDMDESLSLSLSLTPTGPLSPLQTSTPDRINQRRKSQMTPFRTDGYDSPVLEKISQFNNMSGQSRQQERRTTDALRRAVLGREEAEVEMKRMKDEIDQLQSAIEQGKERERKVGQRLETVMVRHQTEAGYKTRLTPSRTATAAPKRHTHIHRPSGRRKSDEREKKTSSRSRR